jgi:hypothetical protein
MFSLQMKKPPGDGVAACCLALLIFGFCGTGTLAGDSDFKF